MLDAVALISESRLSEMMARKVVAVATPIIARMSATMPTTVAMRRVCRLQR